MESQVSQSFDVVFLARLQNAQIVVNALQPISWKKDQKAKVTVTPAGMRFTVEAASSLQAKSFLRADIFQKYDCLEKNLQFQVNMTVLLDCLNIFGSSTSATLQMCYPKNGGRLVLLLEEAGVLTDCTISTFDPEEAIKFNFRQADHNRIVIDADALREGLSEIDWTSPAVSFLLTPEPPFFRIASEGPLGGVKIDFPSNASQVVTEFVCSEPLCFHYLPSLVQPAVKGLQNARGVNIRMNKNGLLSIMRQIIDENDKSSWVEFVICPKEELSDVED